MIDLSELNEIALRVQRDEFSMYLFIYPDSTDCRITLEKGSTYGKFHMKVDGRGATPSEAFENAIRQFPTQPVGVEWDTKRLAPPVEEGVFTETTTETKE